MKASIKIIFALALVVVIWIQSARSDLFQAAVVESEKMCAWLNDTALPEFAEIGYQARQRLLEIRDLKVGTITCIVADHGFNESPVETSLIVRVDGKNEMGLRYGRPLHLLTPFITNAHLGFWTY